MKYVLRCTPDCPYEDCEIQVTKEEYDRQKSAQGDSGAEGDNSDSGQGRKSPNSSPRNTGSESGVPRPERLGGYKPVFEKASPLPDLGFGVGQEKEQWDKQDEKTRVLSDQVFQAKLRNVMKDNAYDRRVRGRKRGKLDMRSLYKVPMKAENIFTLKEARKNKHYNVILLIDQSASMFELDYGEISGNIVTAAECAVFLAQALDKVGIEYAVVGFSDRYKWHKKFSHKSNHASLEKLHYTLTHTGRGGTSMFSPLKAATQELKKTPDHKNILISMTDGGVDAAPAIRAYARGNARLVEYIDIGIASHPVLANGMIVNNIEELKSLLIGQLKKRIRRG